ncbi:replication initiator protein [Dipodfec virus UOA04_Rod_751]|nr:replication initiator protein [Dipodfec virus UOA04_Rod_751]
MCLFPLPNLQVNSEASFAGIREFKCGACPECLRERSNLWALRAVMESKYHEHSCMVTLTYDDYVRDARGHIVGEKVPDRDLKVCKRDIQLFVKRLRKYFNKPGIKYIVTAEYGSRTHRAHYHAILFGVKFDDAYYYKKSKRNNGIYKSHTLTKLWNHGICTIDNININAACAAYCTKYTAKSRSDDTFMLASKNLGVLGMLEAFNGIDYIIDGRKHPIPKNIWNKVAVIEAIKNDVDLYVDFNARYVNLKSCVDSSEFHYHNLQRKLFCAIKKSMPMYAKYLNYWKNFVEEQVLPLRPSVFDRIRMLPQAKYARYKDAALKVLLKRSMGAPYLPGPGSNCVSAHERYIDKINHRLFLTYRSGWKPLGICPELSCHKGANDTITSEMLIDITHKSYTPSFWRNRFKQLEIEI